jgi:hypothetical protein
VTNVNLERHEAPLQIGCRAQAMLVMAFVALFLVACWLIGTLAARSP